MRAVPLSQCLNHRMNANECSVLNKASLMPCCHAVVDFQMIMSRFSATIEDHRPERSRLSLMCHFGISNEGRKVSLAPKWPKVLNVRPRPCCTT